MYEALDDMRDGALEAMLHPPRMGSTEVHAHQRTDNLAVLIADDTALSLTKCLVDNR